MRHHNNASQRDNVVEIQFCGATEQVTGSCYLIRVNDQQILVDCGLFQGSHGAYQKNQEPFPFAADNIDAMILTHAHLDHSGRIPLLIKAGFTGPIYTQHASYDLVEILLRDAAYIHEKDAEYENRKRARQHLKPIQPLYTIADAEAAFKQFRTIAYDAKTEILPGIQIRLNDAGHILGSAIVECWLNEKGVTRKLVFSGDLGHKGAPILRDPAYIDEADFVVMESTYGNRNHRSFAQTWEELKAAFLEASTHRGNVLIPAFTVGRTQELLYAMHQHYDEWKIDGWHIFLDSPMAIEATKTYAKHWELYDKKTQDIIVQQGSPYRLPNLHLSQTTQESMAINNIQSGAMIIAGSGMCDAGRIRHHLKHNLWRSDCHLIIIGYQAPGTIGRAIVDGAKTINLWGEKISVAAKVHTVGGLSAHADQQGLLDWYGHFTTNPKVALTHGELSSMQTLAAALYDLRTVHAIIPKHEQVINLAKL